MGTLWNCMARSIWVGDCVDQCANTFGPILANTFGRKNANTFSQLVAYFAAFLETLLLDFGGLAQGLKTGFVCYGLHPSANTFLKNVGTLI